MNKVMLLGRLTKDPEVRYTQGEPATAIARFSLAINRRYHKEGEAEADFVSCIAFGKSADFAEKYLHKGTKIATCGRIQTGSYTNREGKKIYTTDIIIEEMEFAESKGQQEPKPDNPSTSPDGFMNIPDGIDEELPFT